jgi:hypothetical protein
LTDFLLRRISSETAVCSPSQEIPRLLWPEKIFAVIFTAARHNQMNTPRFLALSVSQTPMLKQAFERLYYGDTSL